MAGVMAHVIIEVGPGLQIESFITRQAAADLKLKEGDWVRAIVKATEVMIQEG